MQSVKRCSNLSMGRVPAAGSGLQLPPQTSVAKAAEKVLAGQHLRPVDLPDTRRDWWEGRHDDFGGDLGGWVDEWICEWMNGYLDGQMVG